MAICTMTEYHAENEFCKVCDYQEVCQEDKPVINDEWQTRLTNAAELYRQAKALQEQAEDMLGKANEVFKIYTRSTGEFQYRIAQLSVSYKNQSRESYTKEGLLKIFTEEQLKPALKVTTFPVLRITDLTIERKRK